VVDTCVCVKIYRWIFWLVLFPLFCSQLIHFSGVRPGPALKIFSFLPQQICWGIKKLGLFITVWVNAGVGKVRPAGQIRPASSVDPARGAPSVVTLWPARIVPPSAPEDKRLFSRRNNYWQWQRQPVSGTPAPLRHLWSGPWPGISHTHSQWLCMCAAAAPTAAWLMRQRQVASGTQLHVT